VIPGALEEIDTIAYFDYSLEISQTVSEKLK
jgi:hypothetical protein